MVGRGLIDGAVICVALISLATAMLQLGYAPWQDYVLLVAAVLAWAIAARRYHRQFGPLLLLDRASISRLAKFCIGAGVTWGPLMFLLNWSSLRLNHHPIQAMLTFLAFVFPLGAMNAFLMMFFAATVFGRKGAIWG